MTQPTDDDAVLDTIVTLALDIAQHCPDYADQAKRIAELVGHIQARGLDRVAIQDAIEGEVAGSDVSDAQVRTTTEAVLRAAREEI